MPHHPSVLLYLLLPLLLLVLPLLLLILPLISLAPLALLCGMVPGVVPPTVPEAHRRITHYPPGMVALAHLLVVLPGWIADRLPVADPSFYLPPQ